MDKQLLNALDNLAVALEMLSDSLDKKGGEAKTPTGAALQSGDFSKQLIEINQSIKDIKSDTKKILDNQSTILKLQREKKDDKFKAFEGAGKEGNKKSLKDGISIILLIAGAVLAIGFAFKLVGSVDWLSVIALSISLPMIAMAFSKIKESGITVGDAFTASAVVIVASLGIVAASYILGMVKPVGIFQLITATGIAFAFYFIAPAIGAMIQGLLTTTTVNFGGMSLSKQSLDMGTIIKGLLLVPLVMIAASVGIVAASHILSAVKPIGLFQAFTAILIAAAFGAMAYGLGALIGGLKDVDPATALVAGVVIPIVMIALSFAIVGASWYFSLIRPIGLFQALTAILISAVFVVLSYVIKPLMQGVKGINPKDILLGTVAVLALTAAVVGASYLLAMMQPVSLGQLFTFVFSSIAIAVATVVMALAVRVIGAIGTPAQYIQGGISVLVLATAIALSSLILSIGNYTKFPSLDWSIGVGLSLGFFGLAAVLLGSQVMNPFFYAGLGVILVVSATIVAASYILGVGSYDVYPSPSWSLGVGLSLGFFGMGAVLLGTQVMNPFFYAGLAMIAVVALTIVAVSYIFEQGSYKVYPPVSWVVPTMLILGGFASMAILLGIVSPIIIAGMATALIITGTIFLIDKLFQMGSYKLYPPSEWVLPTMLILGGFAAMSVLLASISPLVVLGMATALVMSGTIFLIDRLFQMGSYKVYPPDEWVNPTMFLLGEFAITSAAISLLSPFILVGSLVALGMAATIVGIDAILSQGTYKVYPNNEWVGGTISALSQFQKLLSDQSIFGAIGEGVAGLFGASSSDSLMDIAKVIVSIDKVFSLGDYSKYPKKEWVDGTINALIKFRSIINLLNFDDLGGGGNIFSKMSSLFGGKSPLEQAVSNITLLSIAFEKLGSAMNSFASSIQGMDMEKLATIREMTSNVILLSLMDADMLDDVLDKMEERSGVFAELIKNFETSKSESTISKPVRATVGNKAGEKSDAQILGEKVDNMTAILADISTVVGSRGTLKTYLNSIKEKQLTGTSNTPSSASRSDKRLKNIIRKIGESALGINIYLFTYTFNPHVIYQGVIAQELLGTPHEGALLKDKNGFYSVDYSKIDVEFKRLKTT